MTIAEFMTTMLKPEHNIKLYKELKVRVDGKDMDFDGILIDVDGNVLLEVETDE